MILDTERIRRRRVELKLSQRTVASALGTASGVVVGIEAGTNHPDLTIAQLARLAEVLAIDVADLFSRPRTPELDEGLDDDAAVVGALVWTAGVLTPVTALAEAAGWPLARTNTALDDLEVRLGRAGLRLHRQPGKVGIARAVTDEDAERIKSLLRIHLARDGISASEAKLLRRVAAGDVPNNPSNPEAVALGVLANAELITAARAPQQSPAWVLADDVRYSLLLDD